MKTFKPLKTLLFILWISLTGISSAFCQSPSNLEQRVLALEETAAVKKLGLEKFSDTIGLSGAIELDYSLADDSDVSDKTRNSSFSSLDIGTVELGLEARLHETTTATFLLKGENLDTDTNIFWDEAFFTFRKKDLPLYFVGGKRVQPFGAFENRFINDPVTQELYEVNKTGATIGFTSERMANLDINLTVYKGETLIERVSATDFGWERNTSAGRSATDDVSSVIISASVSPLEKMRLSGYFNSEPGDSDRNTTLGASFHWEISKFIVDAEYIGALGRENHVTDNKEYNEAAWVAALGYRLTEVLVAAARYENFKTDQTKDGNLDCRYGVAATYTLFETDFVACNLMGEFRRTEYEASANSTVDSAANEVFARLALQF
ncbi:MAG: LbtU family siderophore porin [Proteobacteria bacterium]|nr:LbtU family siderophore porin [Pseudomonadota bacterium]